ncbi:MAG: PASTA domain-containing protein, partial [Candidatus Hydrogenedentes bacterium]|nr:PASTA domain-containing protein [Candidatus Hydrogenedentota bacterium]
MSGKGEFRWVRYFYLFTAVVVMLSLSGCPKWFYRAIPDVTGRSMSDATALIVQAGFTVGQVSLQCSNTVAAGTIISQTPPAGSRTKAKTPVILVVSTGTCPPQFITVPNVTGLTPSEASAALASVGLNVGNVSNQCSNTVPANHVISQNPSAGAQVTPGTVVQLTVSSGPCTVTVPDVTGQNQATAQAAIQGAGLVVGQAIDQCSDTVPAGQVISTAPQAGAQVTPGTVVQLTVSSGPCTVVPDVTGQDQAAAQAAIQGAGLVVGQAIDQCSNTVPANHVISQNP